MAKKFITLFILIFMTLGFSIPALAALNTTKQPPSSVGFEKDSKTKKDTKTKNTKTGSYGYKDSKGRYWVPNKNMHGGEGWTREWKDGSHDHVYTNGSVRKHKGNGQANFSNTNKYGNNVPWYVLAGLGILSAICILTPIPGDEVIVGGALFAAL
ncbi:MAG TPA: hypothetical protein DDY49_11140 [Paenibacillaceae bacterium]|nr:hypothetical protein [Paenibacillaceae bacterium]